MTEKFRQPVRRRLCRPSLTATLEHGLFPGDLVGEWMDQLRDVCDELDAAVDDAWLVHDLVALTGKLQRSAPELVAPENPDETLARAESRLVRFPDAAEAAWQLLKLSHWSSDVRRLSGLSSATETELRERVEWAVALLEELDDAELIWAAGQGTSADAPAWQQRRHELDAAIRWLMEHEQAVLPAEPFIQHVAATVREDLDWRNLDDPLAQTIRKYEHLLDRLEFQQWERNAAQFAPAPTEQPPAVRPGGFLLFPDLAPAPQTAADGERLPVHIPSLTWTDPKWRLKASLFVPAQLEPDDLLELEFYPDGKGTLAELGEFPVPILLGGLRGRIELHAETAARATFTYDELAAVQRHLDCLVVRNTAWKPLFDLRELLGQPPDPA